MKPSREFKFDTSKINIEPIGNAREVGGYGFKEVVSHKNLNDMMANISDWLLYLSKVAGKSIYVDRMGGDDSTGDGTKDNPYLSPIKAINEAERYGITFIKLMTSGDHDITENVQVSDKTIFILEESGVTARLRFYNHYSTTNRLYGMNLKRSKIFIALTDGVKVAGPTNPGAAWSSADNVCFLVDEGESEINIVGPVEATALSAASGNPVLIRQDYSSTGAKGHGRAKLAIHGNINTKGELYILDSNGALAQIQYAGTMDRNNFWLLENTVQNQKLYTGVHGNGLGAFTLSLATDGTLSYVTSSLADDISDAGLKTAIENLLDNALNDTGEFDMTVDVTTTRINAGTDDTITSIVIEIQGDQAGRPLPLTMFYSGNVRQGAMREIQGARKNWNIFSNIPELY
jgi:uncharacterized protein with GYD domain